jgi:hypothetical protein
VEVARGKDTEGESGRVRSKGVTEWTDSNGVVEMVGNVSERGGSEIKRGRTGTVGGGMDRGDSKGKICS